MAQNNLIKVSGLRKTFVVKPGIFQPKIRIKAVDGVSFNIQAGECFGLVGESGCGKTTIGRMMVRLLAPTAGKVLFDGKDIFAMSRKAFQKKRREMQIVFQDPFASLNPRISIGRTIGEPLVIHGIADNSEKRKTVEELLEIVGLKKTYYDRYPHEFSGGQRQRICIARALVLNPRLIVADEPVSALDVSIQSQILNLLRTLQKKFCLTYLFISHDLSVVKHFCDRIGVMYLGRIVETASKQALYNSPLHPYTRALLSAIPVPDPSSSSRRTILKGDIPNPADPPTGCTFHTRCPEAMEICKSHIPRLEEKSEGHTVACHLFT